MILTILERYLLLFGTTLRCLQEIQSESEVDEFLHLLITFLNFSLKKLSYSIEGFE